MLSFQSPIKPVTVQLVSVTSLDSCQFTHSPKLSAKCQIEKSILSKFDI